MTTTDSTNTSQSTNTTNDFRSITDWDFKRSTEDEWLGGVASMTAKNLKIDPLFVRAGFAIGALATGGLVLGLYIIAWLLLPSTTNPVAPLQSFFSRFNRPAAPVAPVAPAAPAPAAPTAEQPTPPVEMTVVA